MCACVSTQTGVLIFGGSLMTLLASILAFPEGYSFVLENRFRFLCELAASRGRTRISRILVEYRGNRKVASVFRATSIYIPSFTAIG